MKTFRIILLTTPCVGLGLPASRADFVTVGTPNGGTRDPLLNPGTSRFEQVYSASVFGNVPILITGVAFVSNADSSFLVRVKGGPQPSTWTLLGLGRGKGGGDLIGDRRAGRDSTPSRGREGVH